MKFYPFEKEGGEKSHVEGGRTNFGVVFTGKLEVLAILKQGHKTCPPFKRKGYPVLRKGGAKKIVPTIFPFCSVPPSP